MRVQRCGPPPTARAARVQRTLTHFEGLRPPPGLLTNVWAATDGTRSSGPGIPGEAEADVARREREKVLQVRTVSVGRLLASG
jgi:hypothetical protein